MSTFELYVHIPFCRSKCRYCDFASWAGREGDMEAYADAVLREAAARAKAFPDAEIGTFFLGGGTPSTLPPALLERLLGGLRRLFCFSPAAECTTEANPGSLTAAWLDTAVRGGVNRLSLGMQALQPHVLRTLGRTHSFAQVEEAVSLAVRAGLDNLSLDLMFGIPGQSLRDWGDSLDAALSLPVTHLSCYGLIPEDGTPLKALLDAGEKQLPDEEDERAMYELALRRTREAGMAQYEVSNFARPGRRCRHNIGYWRQVPYIGLGASAASMLPAGGEIAYTRETNPRTIDAYLRMSPEGPRETERISPAEARFETMMLGLRMTEGVSEEAFLRMHGVPLEQCYGERLRAQAALGLVEHTDGCWRLTRRGMDVQNSVLVALMED